MKMKQNKILFVLFVIMILFIVACQSQYSKEMPKYDSELKKMCEDRTPDNWMNMKPMKNGEFTSDESCWGCMSDDGMNHYCTKEEYLKYLSTQK